MQKQELTSKEYNSYYKRYIELVPETTDLKTGLEDDKKMVNDFFSSIPEEKLIFSYALKKWTVKEILQHIIDTERIFTHRLFSISRQDKTPLPSYEQDDYIDPSEANNKTLEELLHEFTVTRLYTTNIINSISDENLSNMGIVSNSPMSARACAFLLLGHSIWHIKIIKERYL
ncbi:DinB family protein [uncultured Polaribacter sp.]|uniref:DinB family protein n=1 Tax=uncultured Polaribacter sp. TaxID=174711 RepID=UPI002602F4DC|nr:DinB family protein [uncultured Polaribacter sp.]